VVLKDICRY